MKVLRAILVLAVIAAALFLAFRGCRTVEAPKPAEFIRPQPTAPVDPNAPNPLAPWDASKKPANSEAPGEPPVQAPPAPPATDPTLAGTPVRPADEVSLVVPYKTGTKSRYRVEDARLWSNRDTGEKFWWRYVWVVSTEVVQGDGSGAARVRFEIDSFKYQTTAGIRRVEIDSEHPDRKLLDDKEVLLGRTIKPWLAVLKTPVEFVLDEHGVVRSVEGVTAMNRKFLDAVAPYGTQEELNADDAPTAQKMVEDWGAWMFPALGGGKLGGGGSRDTSFQITYVDRWAAVIAGKLRVTHDDPGAFRVEFKGTPKMEEQPGAATHPKYMNVEKSMVLTDADAHVASWRFDRAAGRLLSSRLAYKYCLVVAYRAGRGPDGQPEYDHPYTDLERSLVVELLGN